MTKITKGTPDPTSAPPSKAPATDDKRAPVKASSPARSADSGEDLMEVTSSESSPPPPSPGAESPVRSAFVEPSGAGAQKKPAGDDEKDFEDLLYEDDTFHHETELLSIVPTSEAPAPKEATSPPPEPRIAWTDTESDTFGVGALPDSSSDLEVQLSHSEVESDTLLDDGEGFNPAPVFEPPEPEEPALLEDPESGAPAAESHPELPDFPAGRQPKWFQVGKIVMTGDDIKLTIKVVEQMETGLIACIDRRLKEADNPQGVPGPRGSQRVRVPVPAPGGGRRVVTARTRKDSVPSVKGRFLSRQERSFFLKAAEYLPNVRHPVSGKSKQTDFKREVLRVLGQPNVELYELRTLLPIKESGSLAPISKSGTTKPPPRYQRVASTMLRKKARELGI